MAILRRLIVVALVIGGATAYRAYRRHEHERVALRATEGGEPAGLMAPAPAPAPAAAAAAASEADPTKRAAAISLRKAEGKASKEELEWLDRYISGK